MQKILIMNWKLISSGVFKLEKRKLYISDLHLGHRGIIKADNRPFSSVQEMDEYIVSQWNSAVCPDDEVWVLGDVCMSMTPGVVDCLRRMAGHKHLVIGNHDKVGRYSEYHRLFESLHTYYSHRDGGLQVCMFHFPIESWDRMLRGSVHLHGHVHGNRWDYKPLQNRYNVWCKYQDYRPLTLEELKAKWGYNAFYYEHLKALYEEH